MFKQDLFNEYPPEQLHWLVLRYDMNGSRVRLLDMLKHPAIVHLCRTKGKHIRFKTFEKELRCLVWAELSGRAQYELGVSPKFAYVSSQEIDRLVAERKKHPEFHSFNVGVEASDSIDIALQLFMHWKPFVTCVYRHREQIVKNYDEYLDYLKRRVELKLSGE